MVTTVDARGLPCPQPVILTRQALQTSDEVITIVDGETSRHNVTRMAERQGHTVQVEPRSDGLYLHIQRGTPAPVEAPASAAASNLGAAGGAVLLLASESLGRGEHPELGQVLVRAFFHTLGEMDALPQAVVFANSGVQLVVDGSPVIEDLRALADAGVEILACGTCLDYYGLKDQLAVGTISNMYTIAELLLDANKVISL